MAANLAMPMVLAPIGGAVATFGLQLPFLIAAVVALLGFFFALRFMHDVSEIRLMQAAQAKKIDDDDATVEDDDATVADGLELLPTEADGLSYTEAPVMAPGTGFHLFGLPVNTTIRELKMFLRLRGCGAMKSCKLRDAHYPSAQCIFEDVETADTAMELLQGQRLDPDLDVEIRAEKI